MMRTERMPNGLADSVTTCWNKKLPNCKKYQIVAIAVFTLMFFRKPKMSPNIWATFVRNFVGKNIK